MCSNACVCDVNKSVIRIMNARKVVNRQIVNRFVMKYF